MNRKNKVVESFQEHEVQVVGRHLLITDAMKAYAIEKFNKIDKFSCRVVDACITMDIQKLENSVSIVAHVNNIKVRVSASSDNMYASIDKASDRLQSKIRKYTEFLHEHHAKRVPELEMNVDIVARPAFDLDEINSDIEFENQQEVVERFRPHEVVSKETRSLKILNKKEAILKMELSQDLFMLFLSEEDRKLKVIYRRTDGNYGIIEPEISNPETA